MGQQTDLLDEVNRVKSGDFSSIYLKAMQIGWLDEPVDGGYGNSHAQEDNAEELAERAQKLKQNFSIDNRNDYAVSLMRNSRPLEAIEMLKEIEKDKPGRYQTAANMGTAYELAGKDDDALVWIKEGIKRNPTSHEGTEWLHVKILEAKIAEREQPGWMKTHAVSGADFGNGPLPSTTPRLPAGNDGKPLTNAQFQKAIEYQVAERVQFVGKPNAVVGDLAFDYGNSIAINKGAKAAVSAMEYAKEYGTQREVLMATREKALFEYAKTHQPKNPPYYPFTFSVVGICSLLGWAWIKSAMKVRAFRSQHLPLSPGYASYWASIGFLSYVAGLLLSALFPLVRFGFLGQPSQGILSFFIPAFLLLFLCGRALSGLRIVGSIAAFLVMCVGMTADFVVAFFMLLPCAGIGLVSWITRSGALRREITARSSA